MLVFQFKNGLVVERSGRVILGSLFKKSLTARVEVFGEYIGSRNDDIKFIEGAQLSDIRVALTEQTIINTYTLKHDSILEDNLTKEEYISLPADMRKLYMKSTKEVVNKLEMNLDNEILINEIGETPSREFTLEDLGIAMIMEFDFDYNPASTKWDEYLVRLNIPGTKLKETGSKVLDEMMPMAVSYDFLRDLTRKTKSAVMTVVHENNPFLNVPTTTTFNEDFVSRGLAIERGRNITIKTHDETYEKIQIDSQDNFSLVARNKNEAIALMKDLINQYEDYFNIEIEF